MNIEQIREISKNGTAFKFTTRDGTEEMTCIWVDIDKGVFHIKDGGGTCTVEQWKRIASDVELKIIPFYKREDNFIAVQMSGTKSKWTKTELEAEEYINKFLCEPNYGACRAEWDIWTREEYEDLIKEDENND